MIQNLPEKTGNLLMIDLEQGKSDRLASGDGYEVDRLSWTSEDGILFFATKKIWNAGFGVGLYHTPIKRLRSDHPVDAGSAINIIGMPRERPDRMVAWVKSSAPSSSDQKPQHLGIVEYSLGISSAPAFGRRPNARPIVHTYPSVPGAELLAVEPDREGELGWCIVINGNKMSAHLWSITDSAWLPLNLDLQVVTPLELDFDRRTLWCARNLAEGGSELVPYDCVTQTFGKPRLQDKAFSLSKAQLFFSRVDRSLAGVSYPRVRRQTVWFLPRFAAWQKLLDKVYPGLHSHPESISDDERRLLFRLFAPNHPGSYVMLDTTKPEIRPVGSRYEEIDAKKLLPTKIVEVKTRDSRRIFAFLTLPDQLAAGTLPPLVVSLANEPNWRVGGQNWVFDGQTQWLASQGYAVLHPILTPSSLQVRIPFDSLHPSVQSNANDIVDAVRKVLDDGVVNGGRIYVIGEYANAALALQLPYTEPGMFRGVAVINAIYDWPAWMRTLQEWRAMSPGERLLIGQMVEQAVPAEFPYTDVKNTNAPKLFIAAETDRSSFLPSQARNYAKKRADLGQPVQTYFRDAFFREEFSHPEKTKYYNSLLAFFSEQPPPPSGK